MPMPPADRSHRRLPALLAGVLGAMVLAPALAAQPPCAPRYPGPETSAAMFDMTQLTLDTLDALLEVDVVIVARGGQDLSRYGLHHSHLAFLARNPQGRWEVLHLLNRCRSDHSDLYREGLVNLVGESALRSDLRIGIPVPALRAQLQQLLAAPASQARALHQPRYSMLAYPGSGAYQNSNQWVLEVTAAAAAAEDGHALADRDSTRAWLRQQGYQPTRLHIGIGKRLGARFLVENIAVTDHPAGERISGNYSVVTVESVFDFLHRRQLLQRELSIPAQAAPAPDATR